METADSPIEHSFGGVTEFFECFFFIFIFLIVVTWFFFYVFFGDSGIALLSAALSGGGVGGCVSGVLSAGCFAKNENGLGRWLLIVFFGVELTF